jgi:hypothetical protein
MLQCIPYSTKLYLCLLSEMRGLFKDAFGLLQLPDLFRKRVLRSLCYLFRHDTPTKRLSVVPPKARASEDPGACVVTRSSTSLVVTRTTVDSVLVLRPHHRNRGSRSLRRWSATKRISPEGSTRLFTNSKLCRRDAWTVRHLCPAWTWTSWRKANTVIRALSEPLAIRMGLGTRANAGADAVIV